MRDFRLRSDLERSVVDGFAYPLGVDPGDSPPPLSGYTVSYTAGEEDDPDTYVFNVVVSHERLEAVLEAAFSLLPSRVTPIVEIGSRDAYRSLDVYLGREIGLDTFLAVWQRFRPILLEDATIGVGINADEPFVEVFLDLWKSVSIHVPLDMRDEIEAMLNGFELSEVPDTRPEEADHDGEQVSVREVLLLEDEHSPDLDELLLQMRQAWGLELNVDPETNLDDAGRSVGLTLWHALMIGERTDPAAQQGAYISVWATAGSLSELESLVEAAFSGNDAWLLTDLYSVDRVAFDDRPDELQDMAPRRERSEIHRIDYDTWGDPPPTSARGETAHE